jgi:hypothetical protein
MRYGDLVQSVRRETRARVSEAIVESRPRSSGRKAQAVYKGTFDGLIEAIVDEIFVASKPGMGMENDLADMIALKVISEVARRTTMGSC